MTSCADANFLIATVDAPHHSPYKRQPMGHDEAAKLRDAVAAVKHLPCSAADKADALERYTKVIEAESGGMWHADRAVAADGAFVFFGRQSEVVVITRDGVVLRGGIGSWHFSGREITLDYNQLRQV